MTQPSLPGLPASLTIIRQWRWPYSWQNTEYAIHTYQYADYHWGWEVFVRGRTCLAERVPLFVCGYANGAMRAMQHAAAGEPCHA